MCWPYRLDSSTWVLLGEEFSEKGKRTRRDWFGSSFNVMEVNAFLKLLYLLTAQNVQPMYFCDLLLGIILNKRFLVKFQEPISVRY